MNEDVTVRAGSDGVSVHAGFPNPALDRLGQGGYLALDLNQLLLNSPSSSYLFRVSGDEWQEQGVFDGDVAIIDRALTARPHDVIIAWQASGFIITRAATLSPSDRQWGIVTAIIHNFRPAK